MGRIPTIYYCPYKNCSASYDRKHRYDTHIRTHTGERPFICSHEGCGKNFTSSSHLKRHEDTHGTSFRCTMEDCLVVLKTKATLKKHIKKVHLKIENHKVYKCTQCGKVFNKHNILQKHELRHSGELPYKCSVEDCQKAFLTPSKLKRHMKIHEGYPCKVLGCDKVFEKWTLYVRHTRDCHPPEYKCHLCSKVFSRFNNLKAHAILHEESRLVYPCEVPNCSRYYYAEKNLRWHMRKYHAKRPFMCHKENCHRAFKTEADLNEHVLYHGKKKPRKKKNKKPKPSLAEILSGVAAIEQENRESKEVLTEEEVESDISISSSKLNLTNLELGAIQISSIFSLKPNQSCIMEENSCPPNERNISYPSPKAISVQNVIESSQSDTSSEMNISSTSDCNNDNAMESKSVRLSSKEISLEMDESCIEEELDSVCSTENHVPPVECEIGHFSPELKIPESAVEEYTTIEVVGSEKLSQFISVPVIQIDDKHWNKNVSVHIETIS